MEDFEKQPLYVFPYPTIDLINFEAGLHGTLRIFDAQGKLELETTAIETGTLQLPKLKTGLYHIAIETSDYFFSSLLLIDQFNLIKQLPSHTPIDVKGKFLTNLE